MIPTVYKWRSGYNYKCSPEDAAQVMNGLADAGELNAERLVEISRPEDAPLHNDFEWNDTKAAEQWRKQQGRCMINSLLMIPEEKDTEIGKDPVRAFFKVSPVETAQYESTQVLIRSEDGREAMREQAQKELISYVQKFRTILAWTGADVSIKQALRMIAK